MNWFSTHSIAERLPNLMVWEDFPRMFERFFGDGHRLLVGVLLLFMVYVSVPQGWVSDSKSVRRNEPDELT